MKISQWFSVDFTTTTEWQYAEFVDRNEDPILSNGVALWNDDKTSDILFSWNTDGSHPFTMKAGDSVVMDGNRRLGIAYKSTVAGKLGRIWAW